MLSKVLSHRDSSRDSGPNSSRVQPMVFPSLGLARSLGRRLRSQRRMRLRTPARSSLSGKRCVSWNPVWQRSAAKRSTHGRRQGEQQARAELQPVLERLNTSISEIVELWDPI